jgi:hypothetical protein
MGLGKLLTDRHGLQPINDRSHHRPALPGAGKAFPFLEVLFRLELFIQPIMLSVFANSASAQSGDFKGGGFHGRGVAGRFVGGFVGGDDNGNGNDNGNGEDNGNGDWGQNLSRSR